MEEKTYVVTEIAAKSGVTFELKGVWYKSEFTETRKVLDDTNMDKQRLDLWETINYEVDKQVEEIKNSCL